MALPITKVRFPTPDGPLCFSAAPSDSAVFGFPFFQLHPEDSSTDALAEHLKPWLASLPTEAECFVLAKLSTIDVSTMRILAKQGFYFIETMLTMQLSLSRMTRQGNEGRTAVHAVRIRPFDKADLDSITRIARSSFSYSRLHVDPNLPVSGANQRYGNWIDNALESGESILVCEDSESKEMLGFFQFRETSSDEIYASLAAVDPRHISSGVGLSMLEAAFDECRHRGYNKASLDISTNNRDSFNVTSSMGFRTTAAMSTFHWFRTA